MTCAPTCTCADIESATADTPTNDFAELAQLTRRRGETYGLLSRLYRVEASEALLAELRGMRFPASTGSDAMDRGQRLISGYLGRPADGMALELAVDYTRTFIGAGVDGHAAAYPFESVYTSKDRLLRQDARDEVLALYRSEGLNKSGAWKDEEDHVALELEFEAVLCDRAAEALEAGNEDRAVELFKTQRGFLAGHLLNWVPGLTADMRHFAKTDLYRGLADLTDGFLAIDQAFLDELLGEEDETPAGENPAEQASA